MRIFKATAPGAERLARIPELTKEARQRLKWMDYYESCGKNAALTCRHFDISRQTLYRWMRRYDRWNLKSLESRSHRPRRLRQPTWSPELAQAVLELREERPRWGKSLPLSVAKGQAGGVAPRGELAGLHLYGGSHLAEA